MNSSFPVGQILQPDAVAMKLLVDIEKENPDIADFILKHYQNLPVDPAVAEKAYDYLLERSVIFSAMASSHGSSVFTEFLYNGILHPSPAELYVLECKAGKAVKSRLMSVENQLVKIIENLIKGKNKLLIGNFGSGPGRDTIDVLARLRNDLSKIKAIHIDKDGAAINRGLLMAKNRGVEKSVQFVHESFMKYNSTEKFDIIILVGVLCPLNFETCVDVLLAMRKILKTGGLIIASNVTPKMQTEDSFSYFLMKWLADWKLEFKSPGTIQKIFKKAGYKWQGGFADDFGFHFMGMGNLI